jgi:dihydroxy-acid dehydratase
MGAAGSLDISRTNHENVRQFFKVAPGNVRSATAFSQSKRYAELDLIGRMV